MEVECGVPLGDGCAGSLPQPSARKRQLLGSLSLLGRGAGESRDSAALLRPRCWPDPDLCLRLKLKIAPAQSEELLQMGGRLLLTAHPFLEYALVQEHLG